MDMPDEIKEKLQAMNEKRDAEADPKAWVNHCREYATCCAEWDRLAAGGEDEA